MPAPCAPDIELPLAALRARRSAKWTDYPPGVLPAWIAEMDYALAAPVLAALEELVRRQDGGYPRRAGGQPSAALAQAFSERMAARFGWRPDPAQVQTLTDLTQGVHACLAAFTEPGDAVVVHTPCYPALRHPVLETGRRFVAHPLVDDGRRFSLDAALLDAPPPPGTRLLLLCNPHNPTGRAFDAQELRRLADYAERHDLVIVSDEVHADFVYAPGRHVPMASLGADVARRCVTLNSASKSFNMAGLRCAVMHFGAPELAERFWRRVPARLLGQPGIAGVDATIAAWRDGQPWLDAVLAHLEAGRQWLARTLAELPGVRCHLPEATYFAWLDLRDCAGLENAADFLLREAAVAASPGPSFAPGLGAFARLNFATSHALRGEIAAQLRGALARRGADPLYSTATD